jgi:hypothetical protein
MNIEELSEVVYEDLNGRIVSVDYRDDTLTVTYECDYWKDPNKRVSFRLVCSDVAESTACPCVSETLRWTVEHSLLLNHNDTHGSLFFSSAPHNPHEVVGLLYQTHEDLFQGWRPLRDYINHGDKTAQILAAGTGVLAEGPVSVLELYQKTIAHLLRTNIAISYTPHGGCKAILFDDCFIVCKTVEVREQSG